MWEVNRNSFITTGLTGEGNEPVVGLALDLTGLAGNAVGTLVPGFLPLVNTNAGVRGIILDADEVANLQAALPAGSSIITVDLTTAGTANSSQAFAILALDRKLAYADEIVPVKWDIDLGLRYGFDQNQVYSKQTAWPFEGNNTYRALEQWFQRTHNQRQYNGVSHEEGFPVITYPSDIEEGQNYTSFSIRHVNSAQVDTGSVVQSPQLAVVLFPFANNIAITQFETMLAEWLTSNNLTSIQSSL